MPTYGAGLPAADGLFDADLENWISVARQVEIDLAADESPWDSDSGSDRESDSDSDIWGTVDQDSDVHDVDMRDLGDADDSDTEDSDVDEFEDSDSHVRPTSSSDRDTASTETRGKPGPSSDKARGVGVAAAVAAAIAMPIQRPPRKMSPTTCRLVGVTSRHRWSRIAAAKSMASTMRTTTATPIITAIAAFPRGTTRSDSLSTRTWKVVRSPKNGRARGRVAAAGRSSSPRRGRDDEPLVIRPAVARCSSSVRIR